MVKKHKMKITVIVLTIIFMLLMRAMTAFVSVPVAASDIPTIFVNDREFHGHHILPLIRIDGVDYIPINVFYDMNSITISSRDNFENDFFLQHGASHRTIAFNIGGRAAFDNRGDEIPGVAARLRGRQIYVPAYGVANILGLRIETREPVPGHRVLRIKDDRTARRSFDDMLRPFLRPPPPPPATAPPTTTAPPLPRPPPPRPIDPNIITEPTTPEATTNPENTRPVNNYLMFYAGDVPQTDDNDYGNNYENTEIENNENLGKVLNFLAANEIRALFFMSREQILDNPGKLRTIFASGHDIGIKIDRADFSDTGELINEVETANAYIYTLIKQKTRLYIVTADFGYKHEEFTGALGRAGYFLCRDNISIEPGTFADTDALVDFLRQQQANLWTFDLSDLDYDYLTLMAEVSGIKSYINFSHINNANISHLN